jgi:t-SNARE complex subunit (syntaxin)
LQEELSSAVQQAQGIERTMREITTINQMISTAVMQQAEMIETLYNNAVDATQVCCWRGV